MGSRGQAYSRETTERGGGKIQGWRSGESARLPPMCPGFDSRTRRHMWLSLFVGSLLCSERFFSGYSGFPSPQKRLLAVVTDNDCFGSTFACQKYSISLLAVPRENAPY